MGTDRDIAERYKRDVNRKKEHLLHKVFPAPEGCRHFANIVIRECDSTDQRIASVRVDEKVREMGEVSMETRQQMQTMEMVRLSIAAVDGVPTENDLGIPFGDIDTWNSATVTAVGRWFNELNGLSTVELEKCTAAGRAVDPSRLKESPQLLVPTEQASTGKP